MKPTYPQSPETWRKYTKGLCDGCWAGCCTLPVEARASDIVRLGLATAEECEWDPEAVARGLLRRKIIEAFEPKTGIFVLAQVAGRDCVYLDYEKRTCTVYDKRPEVCRNFPRIGPRPGYCPHRDK